MSTTKPRLSKRESSSALRQDTVAPSGGKKRTSSIASNASRVSMFANPTKHFGLTRKASTATLSAAPVSVSVGGIDHGLEVPPSNVIASGSSVKGNGADRLRPVRQATRAEDALRSVQSRTPQASVPPPEPELASLSESPSAAPIPLPGVKDALDTPMLSSSPTGTENTAALSSTPPKPKPATPSRIPRLRGQSSSLSITNKDATAMTPAPSTSPPVSSSPGAQPKFRTPALTPEFGASRLARKSSTSSIRSYDPTNNNKQPVSPSPLSQHSSTPTNAPTSTLSAPPPTPASLPVPGTGSSSSPNPTSTNASTQGSSWLAAIRSVGRSNASSPAPSTVSAPAELKSDMNGTALSMNKPSDDSAATLTLSIPQSTITQSNVETSQAAAHNESDELAAPIVTPSTVVVVAPTSTIESLAGDDAHTLTINTLAAQHGARIGTGSGYSPAGWLAWLTSTPSSHSGSPTLVGTGRLQIKDDTDDMVMYIDSDDEGTTSGLKDNGKGKAKEAVKRPGMGEIALSVDSVVPALSEGEGDSVPTISPIGVQPVSQNTLNLNAAALRYALQLPLLGRAKQQTSSPQGRVDSQSSQLDPNDSQANVRNFDVDSNGQMSAPRVETIVAQYSDEHDFVIVEIEVDGWILINTQGASPVSPSTPSRTIPAARHRPAGGNSWWDYYMGGAHPSPTSGAPARDGYSGPAAEMAGGLSSRAKSTEPARDFDARSANSSLFSTVLRPFGRGRETKDQEPSVETESPASRGAQENRPAKTQAELVKEEALARQLPSAVPGLPSPVLNTATKSSWVSYFSSRASRSTPAMSDGRAIKHHAENTGEMEVMDINEDDLSEPVEVQVPNSPISTPINRAPGTSATEKPAPPLTDSPSVKRKASIISQGKKSSASSSRSTKVSFPNLVLPTFGDTFYTVPRCVPPRVAPTSPGTSGTGTALGSWKLKRTVKNLANQLFTANTPEKTHSSYVANAEMEEYQRQVAERRRLTNRANFATVQPAVPRSPNVPRPPRPGNVRSSSSFGSLAIDDFGNQLPRVFSVLGDNNALGEMAGPVRAVVIGVHGWFPGAIMRSVFGEPTGTSVKFANMGVEALRQFAEKHGVNLESAIPMPLEGEGTIERRVSKLYDDLLKHPQWLAELHRADMVLVATHSQGSIVSTHLIARLISDGHIRTRSNRDAVNRATEQTGVLPPMVPHRVCCLAMCGIHMGPLYSLNSSSLAQPYLQWFESQAARELFEFQNTDSEVSRNYVAALSTALDHGTKFVYVASLNDQVVPIYSGTFVAASHPLILRGLFLDGDAYSSSDFLSNLLVMLLRVKNAGLDEHGLIVHLSEATAGSLSGIGHSTAYEDLGPYSLAVRYMFETSDLAPDNDCKLTMDAFQARASRNDYEIPWLLHSLITDTRIGRIFSPELSELRDSFADWKPTTAVLRDIQRKLAPIRMSPLRHSTVAEETEAGSPASKL